MTNLLVHIFIKDSENIKKASTREQYGILAGVIGIICNIILFIGKFFAGVITSSISISADAFNNLSDAGSSIVTIIGFKMAGKPADIDHPFGHGRIEYLSGLLVSVAIIIMGIELIKTSIDRIIHPQAMEFSMISVCILACSILVKMWISSFNKKLGNKINSQAMLATSTDSLSDCVATSAVLISTIICAITGINIDGYIGVIVALFVLYAGYSAGKETLQPLLGKPADAELVEGITKIIKDHEEIIGMHDLIVHDYGPGRIFVSLHAEIPYNMDILKAHDIIDLTEKEIYRQYDCQTSIHMDPIVTDNGVVNELKTMTKQILKEIDPIIQMHDFRMTQGPYINNLIFDIVVPFGYAISDDELTKMIDDKVKQYNNDYYTVIEVDKSYIQAPSRDMT